jgi:hypothetical protein
VGGTTLGFAALLLSEGMNDEGYKAAWGYTMSFMRAKAIGSERPRPGT